MKCRLPPPEKGGDDETQRAPDANATRQFTTVANAWLASNHCSLCIHDT